MIKGLLSAIILISSQYNGFSQVTETLYIKDERGSNNTTATAQYTPPLPYVDNFVQTRELEKQILSERNAPAALNNVSNPATQKDINEEREVYVVNLGATIEALFNDAAKALQAKEYKKCIKICDNIIGSRPDFGDVYFLKGVSYYALNDAKTALKYFKIAASRGSKDAREILKMLKE